MQAMMGRNNCTCQGERSKAQLMETIGQSAFAAYDTLLYMDTHPQDQEAMAYYHKQAGIRREAMAMGKIRERQVLVYVDI